MVSLFTTSEVIRIIETQSGASLDSLGIAISWFGSAAAAPAIPEVRMTSTKVMNGDKGDSQIGSSKIAGRIFGGLPVRRSKVSVCPSLTRDFRLRSHQVLSPGARRVHSPGFDLTARLALGQIPAWPFPLALPRRDEFLRLEPEAREKFPSQRGWRIQD